MTPEQPNTPEQKEFKWTDAQMIAFGSYIKPSYDISKSFNKFKEAVKKFSLIEDTPPSVTSDHTTPIKPPEQPNTPEQMAEYLIERHRPYAMNPYGGDMGIDHEYLNATQSAIVSAEVARDRIEKIYNQMKDNYRIYESKVMDDFDIEITFWEQTIKYLNNKL